MSRRGRTRPTAPTGPWASPAVTSQRSRLRRVSLPPPRANVLAEPGRQLPAVRRDLGVQPLELTLPDAHPLQRLRVRGRADRPPAPVVVDRRLRVELHTPGPGAHPERLVRIHLAAAEPAGARREHGDHVAV